MIFMIFVVQQLHRINFFSRNFQFLDYLFAKILSQFIRRLELCTKFPISIHTSAKIVF